MTTTYRIYRIVRDDGGGWSRHFEGIVAAETHEDALAMAFDLYGPGVFSAEVQGID